MFDPDTRPVLQRENLETLGRYLGLVRSGFSMRLESHVDGRTLLPAECWAPPAGGFACALGHGPRAVSPGLRGERWPAYSRRVFGLTYNTAGWAWCFARFWADVDDTPDGAASRIRYLLKNDVPKTWFDQMRGKALLCYHRGRYR